MRLRIATLSKDDSTVCRLADNRQMERVTITDADEQTDATSWLPVIGRALAYQCLAKAMEREPTKYAEVLPKVKFLQSLGLSRGDAAEVAGSTAESVRVMHHQRKKAKKNGKAKKRTRSGR